MKTPAKYYILAFNTTTDAMEAEKYLQNNFSIAIMPVPREISSGCGLAIRFQDPDLAAIMEFLRSSLGINGTLYEMDTQKTDGTRMVHKLMAVSKEGIRP